MPQKLLFVDGVTVTPAVALPGNVRADLELGHDALYGPFGDPDPIGDIPEADPRILGEAKQDVCVVGQEGPVGNSMGHWATLRGARQSRKPARWFTPSRKIWFSAHDARGTTWGQAAEG
jgi:hypothetical protein